MSQTGHRFVRPNNALRRRPSRSGCNPRVPWAGSLSLGLGHMKRARTATFLLMSVLVVVLTGCVACELRVTNHTDGPIQFYTGHTKKAVQIPAGATRTIPHSSGRVIIITQKDEVWEYDAVNIPDFTADTSKEFKRLTLPLTVELSGVVMLPSGRKIEPSQKMRPKQ
jgi:hypothetical protein